ncbi:MAG: SAM-dependent methyltransferase [Chlorobi bacterium]|nr:SAM-dependent methyltransferase [Chlorobiota bacterium]
MTQNASKNRSWPWTVEPDREWIAALVAKHSVTQYRLPISATMRAAIEPALVRLRDEHRSGHSLILDAGCGTGASTVSLAQCYCDAFVVGVDRSAVRLRKSPPLPPNTLLVRARLEEFWLMVHQSDIVFDRTLLLYPNPYPKRCHIGRRWYGHPILPTILATARLIELRTNLEWYAADWAFALEQCGWQWQCRLLPNSDVLSPFERKYVEHGYQRWIVIAYQ